MSSFPRSSDSDDVEPTAAGIYDCLLGGQYHSAADEQAAHKVLAIAPEARFGAVENRKFMQRAVRYVAAQGVRQYIDLGSGFPAEGAVHQTAGEIVADPHVVYVDYDPAVAALSRAMVRSLALGYQLRWLSSKTPGAAKSRSVPSGNWMIVRVGSGTGPNISEKMITARAALVAKSTAFADAAFGA